MEPHGGSNDGSGSQPETGLEEALRQMGLESGGGEGGTDAGVEDSYPERPQEADCIYYLRTGFCGYGARCRFNHPRDRSMVMGGARAVAGEFPERVGQPICQYFMRTGTCKFGASCKYHHPIQGTGSTNPVPMNYYGYPLRPGEKECSYYVKTGQCKFGPTCKFHHPQPAGVQVPVPPGPPTVQVGPLPPSVPTPGLYPGPAMQSPSIPGVVVARPLLPPYVPGPYGHVLLSPGMVPFQNWNPYQVHMSPVPSSGAPPSSGSNPFYGITQLSPSAPAYSGSFQPILASAAPLISTQKEHTLPERPGQPDCQYYLKTGDCKYGSSCRYHHPPDLMVPSTNVILNSSGVPFRPAAQCSYFAQNGECKFGPTCKFDHSIGPQSHSPSASSLAVSYSSSSSSGTLAPSSSSPELWDESSLAQSNSQGRNQSMEASA